MKSETRIVLSRLTTLMVLHWSRAAPLAATRRGLAAESSGASGVAGSGGNGGGGGAAATGGSGGTAGGGSGGARSEAAAAPAAATLRLYATRGPGSRWPYT